MLRLLRHIHQATINDLHDPTGEFHEDEQGNKLRIDWLYLDKNRKWFRQGYVDNDFPRYAAITETLMGATDGFAIWDDEAGVLKTFEPDQLVLAEKARAGAKMTLGVEFDIPEVDEAPVPEQLAPVAAHSFFGR